MLRIMARKQQRTSGKAYLTPEKMSPMLLIRPCFVTLMMISEIHVDMVPSDTWLPQMSDLLVNPTPPAFPLPNLHVEPKCQGNSNPVHKRPSSTSSLRTASVLIRQRPKALESHLRNGKKFRNLMRKPLNRANVEFVGTESTLVCSD